MAGGSLAPNSDKRKMSQSTSTTVAPASAASRAERDTPLRRKVLIVEDELSISNLLYVLLEDLNYDGEVALGGQQALRMIERTSFDAILLDLRYSNDAAEQCVSQIAKIHPSLLDRVLVITGEFADYRVMDLIQRHCLPHVPQSRLMEDIHQSLRALFGLSPQPVPKF
ncbi:MAG: response regulator [Terriglobia bacterium]|jgi:DNA-binding NtrC family response regulator